MKRLVCAHFRMPWICVIHLSALWLLAGCSSRFVDPLSAEVGLTCLTFGASGSEVWCGGADGIIRIWDIERRQFTKTYQAHSDLVRCIAIQSRGGMVASGGGDKQIKFWDARSCEAIGVLEGHAGTILTVEFTSDGESLVSESENDRVKVWSVSKMKESYALAHDHLSMTSGIALSRDGRSYVMATFLEPIPIIRDLRTDEVLVRFSGAQRNLGAYCVAYSRCGKFVATGTWQGLVQIWESGRGTECFLSAPGRGPIVSVAFSPDSRLLAGVEGSAGDVGGPMPRLRVWDVSLGREVAGVDGGGKGFSAVGFSPDGKRLAVAGLDGTLEVLLVSDLVAE